MILLNGGLGQDKMTEKEFLKLVGRNLAQYRKDLGLTQQQFADKTGLKLVTVASLECGQSGTTLKTLKKLADALNIFPILLFAHSDYICIPKSELKNIIKANGSATV